jgi:hypothetical protein
MTKTDLVDVIAGKAKISMSTACTALHDTATNGCNKQKNA